MTESALVVEGGAMRGIFAAGVLDAFMDMGYRPFDFTIGVSAGAPNLLGYLAQAPKRSYNVITKLATSKEFYSVPRFLSGGNLIDVKWLVESSMTHYPIEEDKLFNTIPMYAATTNIETGEANYIRIQDGNMMEAIEATSALPIAYKSTPCFSGACFTDGAVADSIPVKEAYRRGARDITVILSHPLSYQMPESRTSWLIKRLLTKNPKVADALMQRSKQYNEALDFIRFPPKDAVIRVVAPPEDFPVKRLTRSKALLDIGYEMGKQGGKEHVLNVTGQALYSPEVCSVC